MPQQIGSGTVPDRAGVRSQYELSAPADPSKADHPSDSDCTIRRDGV